MYAINKKTGRLVTHQWWECQGNTELVDPKSFRRFADGTWDCELDFTRKNPFEPDSEPTQSFMDDSYECCEGNDILLVETLPVGYDDDCEWIEDASDITTPPAEYLLATVNKDQQNAGRRGR
jgi:hypothetical protein